MTYDPANTQVKVLDALSIIVMLEHCDFDWTIATFWHVKYHNAGIWLNDIRILPAPLRCTWCLRCLLGQLSIVRSGDGRVDLINAVKEGRVQIETLGLRDDITRCNKCGLLPNNSVNPLWKENL